MPAGQFFWAGCQLILNWEIQEIQLLMNDFPLLLKVFVSTNAVYQTTVYAELLLFPPVPILLNQHLNWESNSFIVRNKMFFALLKNRTLSSMSSSFQKCWKTKCVNAWEAPWDPYMISSKQAVWFKLSATLLWKLDLRQCCLFLRVVLCSCQLTS